MIVARYLCGSAVDNDDDDDAGSPHSALTCSVSTMTMHDRRGVVPIELTVADDANLGAAVGRKHAKCQVRSVAPA